MTVRGKDTSALVHTVILTGACGLQITMSFLKPIPIHLGTRKAYKVGTTRIIANCAVLIFIFTTKPVCQCSYIRVGQTVSRQPPIRRTLDFITKSAKSDCQTNVV
jgi:hypothetical protein